MKRNYKTDIKKWIPYVPFLLFLLYALLIHSNASVRAYDDEVYKTAWDNISIWEWCKEFYLGWSGRIPLQALDIVFLQFPVWVWRIWNAFLLASCPLLISKIGAVINEESDSREKMIKDTILCVIFALIPWGAMYGAVLWISGSFNYLLPCVGLLAALYPFFAVLYGKEVKRREYAVAVIGVFLGCFAEQTAAVFICLTLVMLVLIFLEKKEKKKVKNRDCTWLTGLEVFGIVNAFILFLAPGNQVRYMSEVPLWDKAYDMYSLIDKLVLGYLHCMRTLFLQGWVFILVILALLFAAMRGRSLIYKGMFGLYSLFTCGLLVLVHRIENESFAFLIGNTKSILYLLMITGWLVMLAIFFYTVYEEDGQLSLILALLALGAFAAGTVVAMSPSIFEAKLRVFFVPYVLLIFIIGLQLQKIKIRMPHRSRQFERKR